MAETGLTVEKLRGAVRGFELGQYQLAAGRSRRVGVEGFGLLLSGLAANAIWHKPWADPVAALALVSLILREGWQAMHASLLGCGCQKEKTRYRHRTHAVHRSTRRQLP